jgi:hypothetical protein
MKSACCDNFVTEAFKKLQIARICFLLPSLAAIFKAIEKEIHRR